MNKANVILIISISILTISIWAFFNRPEAEPPWPHKIMGFCFSPYHADEDPLQHTYPTPREINADLALLAGKTHAIRTYSMEGTIAEIPHLAKMHGINVALGAWISGDLKRNEEEIDKVIRAANGNSNVVRVIIGNEAILRNDIPVSLMEQYLKRVRRAVRVPVSTAEPWNIWIQYPELVHSVDYLAVHLLPYWEGVPVNMAVAYSIDRVKDLQAKFPGKPIVIAEVGWPSDGRIRRWAVASPSNEATFLRRFLHRAKQEKYTYYVMEAFDQPWKQASEGAVGAYWGVYDVARNPKFAFTAPIVRIPEWRTLAGISVIVAIIALAMLITSSKTLNIRGRSFLAVIAFALATFSVWATYKYIHQYLSISTVLVGILVVTGMIGVVIVLLTEAHEWAEVLWAGERRRSFKPVSVANETLPVVSIHVPIYNEPPEMVRETLDALSRLDYPRFEVIVMDNNTKNPAIWQPVAQYCRELGDRFRFFHEDTLSGFKAGALNYALERTDPEAAIIGVIDSDYVVDPAWLRDLVPQFAAGSVAIVQAPQDYRDDGANVFKSMCYAEYRGFFFIGMVTRNERNAIIQHGTMTLIRRSALHAVGGWSEWCITEDAELGLRIFEHGNEAIYIPRSYGRGLMPDTFIDYKKQRFRWAYGAMQIMRRHGGKLAGTEKTRLTLGQRYHFWAGWLPWIADGLNLLFNLLALLWSFGMAVAPERVDPPLIIFAAFPLVLFSFKLAKVLYLYHGVHIVVSARRTLAAAVAGLALSHTIAKAVWRGLFTSGEPFFRTPKMAGAHALRKALAASREEIFLMTGLWVVAFAVAMRQITPSPDLVIWIAVLIIQSLPYLATVTVSLISAFPALKASRVLPEPAALS